MEVAVVSKLTKDQQELVSLLRQIGYELSPSTYTDINGLIGFDVSGGFHVRYDLTYRKDSCSLFVYLSSIKRKQTIRLLTIGLGTYHVNECPVGHYYDYGTMPYTKEGSYDHDNSYMKVYKSDIVEEELYELVVSMPKSHAKAFKIALNKIPLYNP